MKLQFSLALEIKNNSRKCKIWDKISTKHFNPISIPLSHYNQVRFLLLSDYCLLGKILLFFCSRYHLVNLNHLTIGIKIRSKRKAAALSVASAFLKAQAVKAHVEMSNSFDLAFKYILLIPSHNGNCEEKLSLLSLKYRKSL